MVFDHRTCCLFATLKKSSIHRTLYVPSAFKPAAQLASAGVDPCPPSVPDPTYRVFTGPVTDKLPEQPPPPMPCVLPFQAPCTPPVPPSTEFTGRPTRMLMFCAAPTPCTSRP